MAKKTIDANVIEKLEASKKAALQRIAKNLKEQAENSSVSAYHSSHSSGSNGRTHSSIVSS